GALQPRRGSISQEHDPRIQRCAVPTPRGLDNAAGGRASTPPVTAREYGVYPEGVPSLRGCAARPPALVSNPFGVNGRPSQDIRRRRRWETLAQGRQPRLQAREGCGIWDRLHTAKWNTPHGSGLGRVRVGGRADGELAQGAAADAGLVRPAW